MRTCICGKVIPFDDSEAPVAMMDPLKFYRTGKEFGHPQSRQKVFTCGTCTPKLMQLLRELQDSSEREEA